eukprot:1267256-Heterocapsa_arctica.AAC.1
MALSCIAMAFQSAGVKFHPEQARLLEKQEQGTIAPFRWATQVLLGLPQRATSVIGMDANAKVGSQREDDDTIDPIGPYYTQVENLVGYHLHEFAANAGLALANARFLSAAGPTWSGTDRTTNRIDYIAIPKTLLNCITSCHVAYRLAIQLQAAATTKWLDHEPLMIVLQHRDWHDPLHLLPITTWDRRKVKVALQTTETTSGSEGGQSALQVWLGHRASFGLFVQTQTELQHSTRRDLSTDQWFQYLASIVDED